MVNFSLLTSARYTRGRKLTIYVKPRLSELFRYPNNVWSRRVRINGVLLYNECALEGKDQAVLPWGYLPLTVVLLGRACL